MNVEQLKSLKLGTKVMVKMKKAPNTPAFEGEVFMEFDPELGRAEVLGPDNDLYMITPHDPFVQLENIN
jgi:hypothetical protein